MENIYGLDKSIKSFAVANDFVINTNKACYALGQQLTPFCIYANETQKANGVLDFATFSGFADNSVSLLDEIVNYRKDVFRDFGIMVDTSNELKKKLLFYDYLMTISICYVEVPKYTTRDGVHMATFDKFLCTRNPAIMGAWMGADKAEMQAKYSAKITSRQVEFNENEIRFVKLNHTNKGNSITVPRNTYNVEKMTCIPMYMLYAFIEGFKPIISEGLVKFSYLKDNGTIRDLVTTLNKDILMQVYNDNMFVGTMLSGVDINSVEQGGMTLSSKMNRGYIKVPEVGSSIYDGTGVRSLNIARLLKAERVSLEDVDTSCINVDLNSTIQNFYDAIEYDIKHMPDELPNIYKAVTGEESDTTQAAPIYNKLVEFCEGRKVVLSTTFFRSLHNFMVTNPQWFPLYTGKPNAQVVSSKNYGVEEMDF